MGNGIVSANRCREARHAYIIKFERNVVVDRDFSSACNEPFDEGSEIGNANECAPIGEIRAIHPEVTREAQVAVYGLAEIESKMIAGRASFLREKCRIEGRTRKLERGLL